MIGELFAVMAPVLIGAGIGVGWSRWGPTYQTSFVTTLVVNVGTPCLVFATLTKLTIDVETFGEIAVAAALALLCFAVIGTIVLRLARLDRRSYLPSIMFGNVGNLGLPLALFAFGEAGLALAIAFFTVTAVANFTVGSWLSSGRLSVRELATSPLNYAVALSIVFMFSALQTPGWLANTVGLIGNLTIPLMLITLGVSLAGLRVAGLWRAFLLSLLRIGMGFAVGYGLAELLGFTGAERGVLILQCAMPVAVFNYLFAQRDNRQPAEAAGLVLVSTIISLATLPLLVLVIL